MKEVILGILCIVCVLSCGVGLIISIWLDLYLGIKIVLTCIVLTYFSYVFVKGFDQSEEEK